MSNDAIADLEGFLTVLLDEEVRECCLQGEAIEHTDHAAPDERLEDLEEVEQHRRRLLRRLFVMADRCKAGHQDPTEGYG